MRVDQELLRSRRCPLRVALNPDLPPAQRHGTVWFEVSGFGRLRRDFLVNDRDLLVDNAKKFAIKIAHQIMLVDPTLPKRRDVCRPVLIDLVGSDVRRVYDLPSFHLTLQQAI